MGNLAVIDLVFMILIGLMALRGYLKGFVEELFSWATKLLAFGAAVFLFRRVGELLRGKFENLQNVPVIADIFGFVAVFVGTIIIMKMLERLLKDVVAKDKMKGLNKIIGFIFGIAEGFAITAIILFILDIQPIFDTNAIFEGSIFVNLMLSPVNSGVEKLKDMYNTAYLLLPGIRITG